MLARAAKGPASGFVAKRSRAPQAMEDESDRQPATPRTNLSNVGAIADVAGFVRATAHGGACDLEIVTASRGRPPRSGFRAGGAARRLQPPLFRLALDSIRVAALLEGPRVRPDLMVNPL